MFLSGAELVHLDLELVQAFNDAPLNRRGSGAIGFSHQVDQFAAIGYHFLIGTLAQKSLRRGVGGRRRRGQLAKTEDDATQALLDHLGLAPEDLLAAFEGGPIGGAERRHGFALASDKGLHVDARQLSEASHHLDDVEIENGFCVLGHRVRPVRNLKYAALHNAINMPVQNTL